MIRFPKGSVIIYLALSLAAVSCAGGKEVTKADETKPAETVSASVRDLSAFGSGGKVEVTLEADGPIQYTAFKLSEPNRLIVDMTRVDMSMYQAPIDVNHDPVKSIRPFYFAKTNDSRIEIDLAGDVNYEVDDSSAGKLKITLAKADTAATASVKAGDTPAAPVEAKPAAKEPLEPAVARTEAPREVKENAEAKVEAPVAPAQTVAEAVAPASEPLREGINQIVDVQFSRLDKKLGRIEITMAKPEPSYELLSRANMNRLTLDLPNTIMDKKDEKLINVNLEQSRIKNVAVFQFRGGKAPVSKIVVNLDEMTRYNISSKANKIIFEVGDEAVMAMATMAAGKQPEEDEMIGAGEVVFTGAKISLDFQKADIHNIIRILADVAGLNIITSDKVKGQVTIKLKNVPWDQALDVIMRNNGLGKKQEGNIVRIATLDEIQKESESLLKAQEAESKKAPLFTRVFEVNYESSEKMKKNLDSMKSERGKVEINERTNTLIIQDTKEKLEEMAKLIDKLDKKESQVLIEAKIVSATHDKVKGLGIQWGGHSNTTTAYGFPNTIGITGGTGISTPNVTANGGGSAVYLPISAGAGGAIGGFGLSLGSVNGTALLDAKLLMLEENSEAVIISNPKITTMNNKEAIIESGQEVPYQTTSAEGTKTEFKKAVLSLKVTPHITPDKHMRLTLQVNKDRPLSGSPPPIETRMAKTEVLVADGETAVLGGLFEDSSNSSSQQLPGLGNIPGLGWLFKNKSTTNNNQELLIFITPKIVD
ncbi:MAG: type IV pilus secretin PilQ [Nitrospinae bacterium]|nr:type IV pilus secretin PilQ [Nitrospinota bacterium]